MCLVRVVLLCKGRGADVSSYQPNRDESQWWSRRDALVRCVASFLFGPSTHPDSRELVLIHDEDYARMEMKLTNTTVPAPSSSAVPTEQTILSIWKEAASNPNQAIRTCEGITCRLVVDETSNKDPSMPSNLDSKREILEYIQKHCSMEFLRQHGLNSSPSVILRKTNKKSLVQVWKQWSKPDTLTSEKSMQDRLPRIFDEVLKPTEPSINEVAACVLHESSNAELPCLDIDPEDKPGLQVCLFLGAVRDMHLWEKRVLATCCEQARIPHVRVRLGPVPEFTSKILTVVAHHHATKRLGPAILRICRDVQMKGFDEKEEHKVATGRPKLHVLCFAPIPSCALCTGLEKRSRIIWILIRITVCALWRSRLASTETAAPLDNTLTILFGDGVDIALQQDELVTSLARQHQAAPCEYQILQELCRKRDNALSSTKRNRNHEWADSLISTIVGDSPSIPTFALDLQGARSGLNLLSSVLSVKSEKRATNEGQVVALLRIRSDEGPANCDEASYRLIIASCNRRRIPIVRDSVLPSTAQDEEAAAVTMLQHFMYQGFLIPALDHLVPSREATIVDGDSNKKRQRKKDKKERKEQKKMKQKR